MYAMTGDAALDFFLTMICQHPANIDKINPTRVNDIRSKLFSC